MDAFGKRRRGGKREKGTPRSTKPPVPEEPEEELTMEEYEKRKAAILRRAVLIENQYIALRIDLRERKKKQAAEQKARALQGLDPDFLREKKEAELAYRKKNGINEVFRDMKMAQISDEREADLRMNETQFDDQYAYAKGRFIDFFKDLIAEKERRERQMGAIMGCLIALPPEPEEHATRALNVYEGRTTRSRSKSMQAEKEERERIARELKEQKEQEEKRKRKRKNIVE